MEETDLELLKNWVLDFKKQSDYIHVDDILHHIEKLESNNCECKIENIHGNLHLVYECDNCKK